MGLLPVLRRVWAKKGQRPVVVVEPRYQWRWLYGFVQPQSGHTHFALHSKVNTDTFNQVLGAFAGAVGAGPYHRVVLMVDGAGWHHSKGLVVPEGLHLVAMPAYWPELQPAERLWPLSNESVANRHFADLSELEAAQRERCQALGQMSELVRSYTLFDWWPRIIK